MRVRTPPLYRTIGADFNTYAVSLQNLFDECFVTVRKAFLFRPINKRRETEIGDCRVPKKRAAEESRGPKSQMQIVLLFDPSLKNAQEKLEYDLPESARSCRDFSLSRRRAVRVNHCSHRSVKSLSVPPRGP